MPEIACSSADIVLLVKAYKDGALTKYFLGERSLIHELRVSHAKGNLSLEHLKQHVRFAFLAAGSGITPMLSLIGYLLKRKSNKM